MTDHDYRALCAELADHLQHRVSKENQEVPYLIRMGGYYSQSQQLIDRARAALAQPEPVAPTDEELDGVMFQAVWECMDNADDLTNDEMDRLKARAVLARYGTAAIKPVPVSERLPGPEDCDAEGRCWWVCPPDFMELRSHTTAISAFVAGATHWLPPNALPTPEVTNV